MFQLVCINSMALCKRLVLVNVNGCYSFPLKHAVGGFGAFTSGPQRREIFFLFLFYTVIVFGLNTRQRKKPRSFSGGSSFFSSLHHERLEKVFETKVDKAAEAGSFRGHVSAARTDPCTPDPPDRQHFLSQAFRFFFFQVLKKSPRMRMK